MKIKAEHLLLGGVALFFLTRKGAATEPNTGWGSGGGSAFGGGQQPMSGFNPYMILTPTTPQQDAAVNAAAQVAQQYAQANYGPGGGGYAGIIGSLADALNARIGANVYVPSYNGLGVSINKNLPIGSWPTAQAILEKGTLQIPALQNAPLMSLKIGGVGIGGVGGIGSTGIYATATTPPPVNTPPAVQQIRKVVSTLPPTIANLFPKI